MRYKRIRSKGHYSYANATITLLCWFPLTCRPLLRLVNRGTPVRIRFGSPFSSKVVVCGNCLATLSLTINETLKWLSSLPILMQESFWWLQCRDKYIISLYPPPLPPPPPPFSSSLISLMVSVDVKHHVYLLSPLFFRARDVGSSGVIVILPPPPPHLRLEAVTSAAIEKPCP